MKSQTDTAELELWPRVEQAINATTISRHDAEWLYSEPCHLKRCNQRHGNPQELFDLALKQVRATVYAELLCQATSDPDLGDENE